MDHFISVIVTAYNRSEYLLDAVKSALNQTLSKEKYEIIVIKNYNDDNIDEFLNKNNIKNIIMDGTIGEYLYKGINESKGDIISFLDDDDLFLIINWKPL
ncbi:glycosyltransferase [Picrophilus oshimae]|uniref:Glycosyltransferase n=1 Tax=Picrophilus torridus (strain ATCC 700027 / DSM 9790 / JCM 10055 / NBRC 100828 / KAW 2/3) TaxID=1122961 RepID=Q6L290_PICTO|nr:glycosyltransferase family A protein [Picrophilus oshimae]AAT42912.1 glycosyltransferase [Picrophilus oshimae DSM 9789]